jgi:hypothetical protein
MIDLLLGVGFFSGIVATVFYEAWTERARVSFTGERGDRKSSEV